MSYTHTISPEELGFEKLREILQKNMSLGLSDESEKRIRSCKAYLDDKMQNQKKPVLVLCISIPFRRIGCRNCKKTW